MSNTIIRKCTCDHAGQDRLHGAGKRVMNKTTKKIEERPVYRCTVCGKEHKV